MKILIVTPSIHFLSGISNFFNVLKGKFTMDVTYFVRGPKNEYKRFRKLVIAVKYFINIFQFIIKINKYDVVHLNTSLGYTGIVRDGIYIILSKLFKKKILVFFHGLDIEMQKKLERNKMFRMIFFKADSFIVLSSAFAEKLKLWGLEREIHLETTVIDDKWLNQFADYSISEKLKNKKNQFSILFVSRIIKEKGIFELLKGFQMLNKDYPECKLIIVGDGKDLEKMVSFTKTHNILNVEYTGYLEGKAKFQKYIDSDVFILPSYTEGMPTVIIEAMAFGLPVIASNVGGIPDLIKSESFGYILKDINPETIKSTIENLYCNPIMQEKISTHNHQYAKEHLTATRFIERIEKIYISLR